MFITYILTLYSVIMIVLSTIVTCVCIQGIRKKDNKIGRLYINNFIAFCYYLIVIILSWYLTFTLISILI